MYIVARITDFILKKKSIYLISQNKNIKYMMMHTIIYILKWLSFTTFYSYYFTLLNKY